MGRRLRIYCCGVGVWSGRVGVVHIGGFGGRFGLIGCDRVGRCDDLGVMGDCNR